MKTLHEACPPPFDAERTRTFFCIDMKCFFASVECAERGLDPFDTLLAVADEARGAGAICLAISPALKARGVKNRCRLYEIPAGLDVRIVKPRMKKYIEYAAAIYGLYLQRIAPEDIHVYSIDEAFLDVTDYLGYYRKSPEALAAELLQMIAKETGIPATAGIGTNLYLAKVALDLAAKNSPTRIAFLDEARYRERLWHHEPITDFWQVAAGTAKRLAKYGVFTMAGVAHLPTDTLYRMFGVNAELLIDHAWGRESCTIADIKHYRSKSRSISNSQILFCNYPYEKAAVVVGEMARAGAERLMREHLTTHRISLAIGYADEEAHPSDHGAVTMNETTNLPSLLTEQALGLFARLADRQAAIRRLSLGFSDLCTEGWESYGLFADTAAIEREKQREKTILALKDRFGKNALLRAIDYTEGATARERNRLIGGHNGE